MNCSCLARQAGTAQCSVCDLREKLAEKDAEIEQLKSSMLGSKVYELIMERGDMRDKLAAKDAEIAQLRQLEASKVMNEGDVCPACACEFEAGAFKLCGGSIVKEAVDLRSRLAAKDAEIAQLREGWNCAADVFVRDRLEDARRLRATEALLDLAVEAMKLTVARADDYADSHLSKPVREALAAIAEGRVRK